MKLFMWLASFCPGVVVALGAYAQDVPNPLIGSHLYRSYCFICHGADGKTTGPLAKKLDLEPADLSLTQYQTKTVDDLAATIEGYRRKEDASMPKWGLVLSNGDLLDIAAYVLRLGEEDLRLTGDTRRGRAIFKRVCIACHGKSGRGRGVLAHLIQISMISFIESENMKSITDEELIDSIRNGKGEYMPSWAGVLNDSEITDVASYVRLLAR